MSLAMHSPLPPSLPNAIMRVSTESEQTFSVSYLNCLPFVFADRFQDSGSGLLANAQNILITGGTFVVGLFRRLYKQSMTVHILSARTIIYLPILEKGIWRSLYFRNQTPVHCLLDRKVSLTSFEWFLFTLLIVDWCWGVPVSFGEQEG